MLWVGDNVPPLLQLPSHMFSPAPSSLFPSQSSILQPAHLFELHTLMLDREEGPPESPTRRAQAVSLPYMKEGSPDGDALWAAQAPAAQRGAVCVPEEAAPLTRLCLAFIGNEDEGFGSGLRGSPEHCPAGKPAIAGQG